MAITAQYSIAKLANDPLLRTSISLVASGSGGAASEDTGEAGEEAAKVHRSATQVRNFITRICKFSDLI